MAHHYNAKDGRVLPSVTTVLGDMLGEDYKYWYASLRRKGYDPDQVLTDMGTIGTICHYRVLSKLSPSPIDMPDIPVGDYPEGIQNYADLFEMMWIDSGLTVKRATCEKFSYDDELGYCGTYDLDCKISGTVTCQRTFKKYEFHDDPVLLDFKTSKEGKEKHFLQLGAYEHFISKKKVRYGIIACLCPYTRTDTPYGNKNPNLIGKFYIVEREELILYQQRFFEMLADWWSKNGERKKR